MTHVRTKDHNVYLYSGQIIHSYLTKSSLLNKGYTNKMCTRISDYYFCCCCCFLKPVVTGIFLPVRLFENGDALRVQGGQKKETRTTKSRCPSVEKRRRRTNRMNPEV